VLPLFLGLPFSFTECRPARIDWKVGVRSAYALEAAEERTFSCFGIWAITGPPQFRKYGRPGPPTELSHPLCRVFTGLGFGRSLSYSLIEFFRGWERLVQRKLAAILAADVVGYSHLMEIDEADTLTRLKTTREHLIDPKIAASSGRLVKLMGDGMLVEFASVVDAVRCAVEIQRSMDECNAELPTEKRLELRIGINLGDIMVDGQDIYGDGVNVAARLEGLCEPGRVLISGTAFDQVERKLDYEFEFLGAQTVKNIDTPVRVYRVPVGVDGSLRAPVAIGKSYRPLFLATFAALLVLLGGGFLVWKGLWREAGPKTEVASIAKMAFPLPDKPSVAVLPFTNMSNNSEQQFADGMTDDLITDLSKVAGLFVIARNSTFIYQGKPVRIAQVAEDLGVRYVLEGSVQRAGDQVRVNAQLIDALNGGHVWADRFSGNVTDIFAVQDEFVGKIVEALEVKLTKHEKHEIDRAKPDSFAAKEAFDEGWSLILRFNAKDNAAALAPLQRAIQLDPEYGRAYAALAMVLLRSSGYSWQKEFDPGWRELYAMNEKYLEMAEKYPTGLAHTVKAHSHLYYGRAAEARVEAEQAIALDPNDPEAHIVMAWALIIAGKPTEALNFIAAAMRLNPNYPSHYVLARGIALFAEGSLEQSVDIFDEGFKRNPQAVMLLPPFASVLAKLGRREEARQKLLIWRPGADQLVLENAADSYNFPFRWDREYAGVRERLLDGLRVAGLPLDATVPRLVSELKSDDSFQRLLTVKRLGWFGPAAAPAVPALIAALQDETVRQEAVKSLGKIGPAGKAAVPALRAIENESLIGDFAKDALAEIGGN
jgi:adenylate cyclase